MTDFVKKVKKGYTIEVTSWENDGDNYNTKSITVDDKDYALAVLQMCKDIFVSGKDGIGNYNEGDDEKAEAIILNYVKDKPLINKGVTDPEHLVNIVMDINYELMGSCEYYYSRVFESGFVYHSPHDIKLEKIA